MDTNKKDKVAEIVTKRIVEALEEIIRTGKGSIPWKKPWKTIEFADGTKYYGAMNAVSCTQYKGINQLLLGFNNTHCEELWYLTLKQVMGLGFRIKKEEYKNSIPVLFWGRKVVEQEDNKGNIKEKTIFFKRFYSVYHWSQIDASEEQIKAKLPIVKKIAKAKVKREETKTTFNPIEAADAIVNNMPNKPSIAENGGSRAYYVPSEDSIHMPVRTNFESSEHFYATLFHEIAHSTGHESRLNRDTLVQHNGFGSHNYSREELVAEISANMLMAVAELDTPAIIENTVAYCQSWLKVLKDDVNFVLTAAAQAQKATDFVLDVKAS